jgi:hypothetical protein
LSEEYHIDNRQSNNPATTFFAGDVGFGGRYPHLRLRAVNSPKPLGSRTEAGGKRTPHRLRQINIWRCVMKTIRSLMILAGLSLAVLALGATGAKAWSPAGTDFAGTFTLPFEAQWGRTTLPAGEYSLYYGHLPKSSTPVVEVIGKDKGSPHAFILPQGIDSASTTTSALVCVREGNALIVRSLEMPAIGESVRFGLPRGAQRTAHNRKHNGYAQLAEAPMLIQRIPVTLNAN